MRVSGTNGMTQAEQQKAAKKFSENWKDKGYEKGESQNSGLTFCAMSLALRILQTSLSLKIKLN